MKLLTSLLLFVFFTETICGWYDFGKEFTHEESDEITGVPHEPRNLQIRRQNLHLVLSWEAQPRASYFLVTTERRSWPVAGGTYSYSFDSSGSSWKEYEFSVKACNADNQCSSAASITGRPRPAAPSQPNNLKAETNGSEIHLSWDEPTNRNGPLHGYVLQYGSTSIDNNDYDISYSHEVSLENVNTYTVSSVHPLRRYQFLLRAFTRDDSSGEQFIGESAYAAVVTPPKPPEKVRVEHISEHELKLEIHLYTFDEGEFSSLWKNCRSSYQAGCHGSCGITVKWCNKERHCGNHERQLHLIEKFGFWGIEDIQLENDVEIWIPDLHSFSEYELKIHTFYSRGCLTNRSPNITITLQTLPAAPRNISAETIGPTVGYISWTHPNETREVKFDVQTYRPFEQSIGTADRYVYVQSFPCTHQAVYIKACSRSACGRSTITYLTTFPKEMKPPKDIHLTTMNSSAISVRWEPFPDSLEEENSTDYCRNYFHGYEIKYCGKRNCQYIQASNTTNNVLIRKLKPKSEYIVEVRFRVLMGEQEFLSPAVIGAGWTMSEVPEKPAFLNAVNIFPKAVKLDWLVPNSTVDSYEVHLDNKLAKTVSQYPVYIRGLKPFQNYTFAVRACNSFGCGEFESLTVQTSVSVPGKATNVTAIYDTDSTIHVTWEPPVEPAGPLHKNYVYLKCAEESRAFEAPGYATEYVLESVQNLTNCTIKVEPCNMNKGIVMRSLGSAEVPALNEFL